MQFSNPVLFHNRYVRWIIYSIVFIMSAVLLSNRSLSLSSHNDFDLTDTLIPIEKIYHGGPPRDGIPAIDHPQFINVSKALFLHANDRVLGLVFDGVARAYPIKILNYHEIVNDEIKGQSIVISYCPLCGSGMAFNAGKKKDGVDRTFGVSGLLYNSDMLLYDRDTESLWSQIMGTAISGKLKGQKIQMLALLNTRWSRWREKYPGSTVLSTRTGYSRNYNRHPYGEYDINAAIYFPVTNTNARYHPKERVIGLTLNGKHKAYPLSELSKQQGKKNIYDTVAGISLRIQYDEVNQTVIIYDKSNKVLPTTTMFWFAWAAFYPHGDIYTIN